MENRFKMRISRMFRGSFASCRTTTAGDLSDVVQNPVFLPQQPQTDCYFRLTEDPLPPKPRPFSSICRPKSPETTTDSIFPREKISSRYPPFISAKHVETGRNPLFESEKKSNSKKKAKKTKKTKKTTKKKDQKKNTYARSRSNIFSSSSQDSAYFDGNYWFSSEEDEDEDEDTLFSSRSTFSSDSSGSGFRNRRKKYSSSRRRKTVTGSGKKSEIGVFPLDGKVKDSFAVVKRSSDPYNDFRTSMVEMIVEKQIFAAYDLEQLLQCFLSLNSDHHHRIIVEVFTEIYEALFSNWA
ncbi:transcription repressor OFP8 [Euphorbia lathyris]|uniref:transcription repressor OFP8 n=1 Tax=Euphorbia lathyris TaxID=212925 RepID=UPI00331440C5